MRNIFRANLFDFVCYIASIRVCIRIETFVPVSRSNTLAKGITIPLIVFSNTPGKCSVFWYGELKNPINWTILYSIFLKKVFTNTRQKYASRSRDKQKVYDRRGVFSKMSIFASEGYFIPDTFQSTQFEVHSTFEVDAVLHIDQNTTAVISNSIFAYRFMERRDIDDVTVHVIIKPGLCENEYVK